jgi:tetratricopeptide (TPR) repeat protein
MPDSQGDAMAAGKWEELRLYLRQQPVMLVLLAVLAVIFFLAVTGLSRADHAQRDFLGDRWFTRGVADLSAHHYDSAVMEFQSALLYSRDNYTYQLNLAEALIGLKRMSAASTYLVNLWDRQPENGVVNLELARIAVQKGQTEQALRYYHNAIYATWPDDQESKRRDARLELIEFLLGIHARAPAESELIALAENLGDDASEQVRAGDLFVRTLDYERAFAAYRASLKANRHDRAALAGAGLAAFELGRYPQAQRYLQAAVAADAGDAESAARLKTTELVLQMDPFQRQISMTQRNKIVVEAFAAAGVRIKTCGGQKDSAASASSSASTSSQPNLAESWSNLKPRVSEQGLQRDPNLVEHAMDLVFEIERQTSTTCGPPTGTDLALLLIADLHEGN